MEQLTGIVEIVTLVTVVGGFLFAAREWRARRLEREEGRTPAHIRETGWRP